MGSAGANSARFDVGCIPAHIENTSGELMSCDAATELDAAATAATADPLA
jgi:hypothetical protein